eukprot:jgi/Ulvmu1/2979/UM015_0019.1
MCSIEKLLIKGIRSVDPHNETAVEFGAPLSLIVGQNGAGKTTIIECLKQATTGAMPPNSKNGQSFVHDPLIAGETEVKALIKLRLRTARDAAIVVFRSFSLTQNKSKKTFKTLDGSVMVQDDETGEMKVLTNKCAEMDKTVPYVMNVSRPILEHVVFVHQEDSLWPLSESKPLKEKFDAIFAATKYTAGLQKIKEDIKAKNQMIKECKIHLGHLKTHRDTARRLRASIKRDTEQQKTLQQRQAAVQEEMQTQKVKAAELEEKLRENEAAIAQIERLELKCGMHEAEVEKLRQALGDGFGDSAQSAAELQSICVKYEEKAARKREKASQLTQERREKEAELAALQEQAQAASSEAARKEAQLDAHRGKVKHAAQLAGTLAQQHGLAVAVPTGEELPEVLQSQLTAQLQQQQAAAGAELEELRGEQRRAQHSVQQQLSTVEAKLASFQADMQAKSDSQAAVQRKLQAARACLQGLPLAMKLENMRGDLEREKAQLDGRSVDAELQQAAADIDATATALRTAAQRVSELRRERDRLAAATQAATRFRVAQESAADLQSQVELLQKQHGPALKAALEELDEPLADIDEPAAAAAACSQLLGAAREQHGEAQRAADSKRQQLLSAQASLGGLQETMGKADSESKRAADRVAQTLDSCLAALTEHFAEEPEDVDAFQTAFSSSASLHDRFKQAEACLQKRRAEAENRSKEAAAQTRYSSTWVTKAKEQNLCAVCQRKFALPAECKEFIARFERNKESAVDNAKVDEEDAVELSKHLDQIAGMSHAVQKHSDWQQDRPGAVAKVQDMQTTCKSLEAEANKAKGDLESASKLLSFAQDLQSSLAAPMQQLLQQCQRVERELQELQLQLEGDEDASRLPQVDTAIQEAEQEVSTLTTSRDELMNKRTALSDDKVKHGRRILQLEQAYMKLTAEVKEREQLESQIVELEGEQSGIADKLSTLQQGNDPLKHQRGALQADLEKMRREHDSEERTKRQHVDGLAASVNQWSGALAEISQFRASGAESAIEDARKRLHDAQRDMQDHAEAVRQLEAAAQKAVDAVQLTEQLKRCVSHAVHVIRPCFSHIHYQIKYQHQPYVAA